MEDSPRYTRRSFHQSLMPEDQWKVRRLIGGESSISATVLRHLEDSRWRRPRLWSIVTGADELDSATHRAGRKAALPAITGAMT
jgi:hypothetical protein